MFEIGPGDGVDIVCQGRLDASQSDQAKAYLDTVSGSLTVDLANLTYLSSAGMGVLLRTQKRLLGAGGGLKLVNVSNHIYDIFRYSGFAKVFEIETKE